MAHQLAARAALAEEPGLSPKGCLTATVTSVAEAHAPSSGGTRHTRGAQTYIQAKCSCT